MKTKYFLTVMIIVCVWNKSFSQKTDWRVHTGIATPENFLIGTGVKLTESSLMNLDIGFNPYFKSPYHQDGGYLSITFEYDYFFVKSKKFNTLNTWYFGIPINYTSYSYGGNGFDVYGNQYARTDQYTFGLVFGKQFNFSKVFGMNLNFGHGLILLKYTVSKVNGKIYWGDNNSQYQEYDWRSNFAPFLRIKFFYRI